MQISIMELPYYEYKVLNDPLVLLESIRFTNAHANKSNLYYYFTGRCDVKISQPKTKGERRSFR